MEYFVALRNAIDGVPTSFVWNMDEIGHSDWADAHPETVYVPGDFPTAHVPVPVPRTGKRITLVGCICLDGSFMRPMVVIPRHTIDNDLALMGVRDSNCRICHQPSGFIDRELFEEWFTEIFLEELGSKRRAAGYSGPAVLVLDGCTAHDGDYFWDTCLRKNVIAIPIPPHSSNQVQPCDLCVFGLTKRLIRRLNRIGDGNIQSVHIAKLVSACHSACNPVNVIASFRNAGIEARLDADGAAVAVVDIDQCRCLLHPLTMADLVGAERPADPRPELDELAESADLTSLPVWLQILEEEASRFAD